MILNIPFFSGTEGEQEMWVLSGLAGLAVLLAGLNIFLFEANRTMKQEIAHRRQFITQSVPLSQLNNQIIRSLANLSAEQQDRQLKQLLANHGITFTINPPESGKPE